MKFKRFAVLALSAFAACRSSTGSNPRPRTIAECETPSITICGTWTRQGDGYVASWQDGATAKLTVERFTSTRIEIRRVDFGKNQGFTAVYTGLVSGRTASGSVTWNHFGNATSGTWTAEW